MTPPRYAAPPPAAPILAINGTPIIGIAGWKKSGKTTLAVRLVAELTRRGYRVATIKHAHHEFQVDDAETDSARHRRAGAAQVAVVSRTRWALIKELVQEPEPNLDEVAGWLDPCDLILVEGYKTAPIRKIEARRTASFTKTALADEDPLVVAIAADHDVPEAALPVHDLDDIAGLAELVVRLSGLAAPRHAARAPAPAPEA